MHIFKNITIPNSINAPVLVVEDDEFFRSTLCRHLRARGHHVVDCAGIENILGDSATARQGEKSYELHLASFSVAFLDHYFQSKTDNGTTLTAALAKLGVTVIGMSSSRTANESMIRQGAVAAFQKRNLLSELN